LMMVHLWNWWNRSLGIKLEPDGAIHLEASKTLVMW
jgi:hypothetical protein